MPYTFRLPSFLLLPCSPVNVHFNIRVKTVLYGAGMGSVFEHITALLLDVLEVPGDVEGKVDTADATGIGFHKLFHVHLYAIEVEAHIAGLDAHDGDHAGSQGGGHQVGRGKTLTLAIIVHRGIRLETGGGAEVGTGGSQFPVINNLRSHTFLPKFTFEPHISIS